MDRPGNIYKGFEPVCFTADTRFLVREIPQKKITETGIILPDTFKSSFKFQEVLAFARGEYDGVPVAVGDKVMTGVYCGFEVQVAGETLSVISPGDVLGVWHEEL